MSFWKCKIDTYSHGIIRKYSHSDKNPQPKKIKTLQKIFKEALNITCGGQKSLSYLPKKDTH